MEIKSKKIQSYLLIIGFVAFSVASIFLYALIESSFETSIKINQAILNMERTVKTFHREVVKITTSESYMKDPISKYVFLDHAKLKKVSLKLDSFIDKSESSFLDNSRGVLLVENGKFVDEVKHYINLSNQLLEKLKDRQKVSAYKQKQFLITYEKIQNQFQRIEASLTEIAHDRLMMLRAWLVAFIMTIGGFIYFTLRNILTPWVKEYKTLKAKSKKLQNIIEETEDSGQTYSWEYEIKSKVVIRSEKLSSLFEIENIDEKHEYIQDELSYMCEESREQFSRALESCEKEKGSFDIEVKIITKSKKTYWLLYSCYYINREGARIEGTVKDISEKNISIARFNKLFEENQFPLIMISDNTIKKINKACLQFLDYENEDDLLLLNPNIVSPLYQEGNVASVEKLKDLVSLADKGSSVSSNWVFNTKSGPLRNSKIVISSLDSSHKKSYVLMIKDSIDTIQLEDRLSLQVKNYQLEVRKKSELVSDIYFKTFNVLKEAILLLEKEKTQAANLGIKRIQKHLHNIDSIIEDECLNDVKSEPRIVSIYDFVAKTLDSWKLKNINKDGREDAEFSLKLSSQYLGDHFLWVQPIPLATIINNILNGIVSYFPKSEIILDYNIGNYDANNFLVTFDLNFSVNGEMLSDTVINEILQTQSFSPSQTKKSSPLKKAFKLIDQEGGQFSVNSDPIAGTVFKVKISMEKVVHEQGESKEVQTSPVMVKKLSIENEDLSESRKVWQHFEGDWDTVQSISGDILKYIPKAVEEIDFAIKAKNGALLHNSATSLYGVLAHLPYENILNKCIILQKHGQYNNFEGVENYLNSLKKDLAEVSVSLETFSKKSIKVA